MMSTEQGSKDQELEDHASMNDTSEESNTIDDIIGAVSYKAEPRKKQEFWPWHKPRKQYVRENQWCDQIRQMIADVLPENNILKYLGLPGDDFLDIRYFHEQICLPNNLQLKFLGFNEGIRSEKRKTEINISLDELSRLDLLHPASEVIPDDFCDIARIDSLAWQKTLQKGPYDIINIDLCDGFGKQPPDKFIETHYTSIARLLSLQEKRPNPWLLLITTRTGKNDIHVDVLSKLKSLYKSNLASCVDFQKASSEKMALDNDDDVEKICETEKGLSDIFLISLCKWLAKIVIAHNSKLELRSVIGYKVYGKSVHQDLVSIAIKVEPLMLIKEDTIGLAQKHSVDSVPNECVMAIQALESVHLQIDADQILANDKVLWNLMLSESSRLLEAARYDITGYEQWASGENKVQKDKTI